MEKEDGFCVETSNPDSSEPHESEHDDKSMRKYMKASFFIYI